MIDYAVGGCSYDKILVAQSTHGICAILLGDDPDALTKELYECFTGVQFSRNDRKLAPLLETVTKFVESPSQVIPFPLDLQGTAFQQRVWEALRTIPAGQTASYSQIASALGMPKAARAVGGACAANVLAVAIPCHRVVRSDGSVSGYRFGVARKNALLERERYE